MLEFVVELIGTLGGLLFIWMTFQAWLFAEEDYQREKEERNG